MKRKPKPQAVDLTVFDKASPYAQNRLLLEWLSDDGRRIELCDAVDGRGGKLKFWSMARDEELTCIPHVPPNTGFRPAYLLTGCELVKHALCNTAAFSNSPYDALGDGSFMLALDPRGNAVARDDLQRAAAKLAFGISDQSLEELCEYAFQAIRPTVLARNDFDLAALAEEAALRFVSVLFGYGSADFGLLQAAARRGYLALNYQILGRHFSADPTILPAANQAMATLLARTGALIDEYQLNQIPDRPADLEAESSGVFNLCPVLQRLAKDSGQLSGEERAALAVGSLVGTVGNVQASVCIAMRGLLATPESAKDAEECAGLDASGKSLGVEIAKALRLHPPVAFLPRRALTDAVVPAGSECILVMAGTTRNAGTSGDGWVFGVGGAHACLGRNLATPLIQRLCAGVLRLPSLVQRLDPGDGLLIGLQKQSGFRCLSYPLRHRRDQLFVQQPLNVVMRIKTPTAANAEALRNVIAFGSPRIEAALRESRHVHFAWFQFIDNDSKLVLHTVYDGAIGAYLQHFALAVGTVFDRLFQYIDGAPPLPVNEFPNEFVDVLLRNNQTPVAGYFFSAYPGFETAGIQRAFAAK